METSKFDKILNSFRLKIYEEMTASGGNLAGLPPDDPIIPDLRKYKKSYRIWLRSLYPQ